MLAINAQTNDNMANYVVEKILAVSRKKQQAGEIFTLALAGGTTPQLIYNKLRQHKETMRHWQLIYSDERFLPGDDHGRNEHLFKQAFGEIPAYIQHYPVPCSNHLDLEQARQQYSQLIAEIGDIDLCLLGMGEDGHSASLFPQNIQANQASSDNIISVDNSPKAPSQRHSFNYTQINRCHCVILLASGEAKQAPLMQAIVQHDVFLPISHILHTTTANSSSHIELLADTSACQSIPGFINL